MCEPVIYGDHEFTKYRVCASHARQLERPKTEWVRFRTELDFPSDAEDPTVFTGSVESSLRR